MNVQDKLEELFKIICASKTGEVVVQVDGYFIDDGSVFEGYNVVVGGSTIGEDDEDIFFYFNSLNKFKSAFNEKDNTDFLLTNLHLPNFQKDKVIEYPLLSIRQDGKHVGDVGYVGVGAERKIVTEGLIGVNYYDDFVELIKGLQGNNIMIDDFFW